MADKFYVRRSNKNDTTGAKTNWAWFFGIFILILISISFILPSSGLVLGNPNTVYFGKYGNRKIKYGIPPEKTQFNDLVEFYNDNYSQMFGSSGSDSTNWIRNMAFQAAFNELVVRYAKMDYADRSGLLVGEIEASRYIINNYYKDENGKFSIAYWKSLDDDVKKSRIEYVRESLVAEHFDSDYSKIMKNDMNIGFIADNIGEARNFNMLVFKGDNANESANNVIASVNKRKSLSDVKPEGSEIIKIENMYKNYQDGTFYPSRATSGDLGEFLNVAYSDKQLLDSLYSLSPKTVYSEPIKINNDSWAVIEFDSEQTIEQKQSAIGSIEGRVEYIDERYFDEKIHSSSKFKDRFSKGYSKLYPKD